MDDAFILHDYSTYPEYRIINFLQYVSTLQKLIFIYNSLNIQKNWGADEFDILLNVYGMCILPFWVHLLQGMFKGQISEFYLLE